MENDQIRLLEYKSRALGHELRSKRVEIGKVDREIHAARVQIASGISKFQEIKKALASVGAETRPEMQGELLMRARMLTANLSQLTAQLEQQKGVAQSLKERRAAAQQTVMYRKNDHI